MRKTIVTLVALCAAVTVNATVLRVSNVSGSTAPYSTIQDALSAAAEGDTIMLDASAKNYTWGREDKVTKRVVIIGPGYWLQDNGIIQEGSQRACIENYAFKIAANGVVVIGVWFDSTIDIAKNCTNVVIKRCNLRDGVGLGSNADRCVFHQNYVRGSIKGGGAYHQITNNIFIQHFDVGYTFQNMPHSYIAYNTFMGNNTIRLWDCGDCTVEKNISADKFYDSGSGTNSFDDNIIIESLKDNNTYDNNIIDSGVQALNLSTTHGAFAGDSPYVISGLPSAPIIEDLQAPTTVEYGSMMNVTIKVGVQK